MIDETMFLDVFVLVLALVVIVLVLVVLVVHVVDPINLPIKFC